MLLSSLSSSPPQTTHIIDPFGVSDQCPHLRKVVVQCGYVGYYLGGYGGVAVEEGGCGVVKEGKEVVVK